MRPLKVQPKTANGLKSWIHSELTRRLSHYRKAMELRHGLRLVRFGRNQINLPPLIREIVPQQSIPRMNMAFLMGEVVQGALASKRPRVMVNPRNEADKDPAERRRAWLALADQTAERQARRPIFWKMVDNIVNDGWGVRKTWWRPWYDFPQKPEGMDDHVYNREVTAYLEDRAAWPIAMRTVDPLTFYPRIGEYGGGDFIESGLRPTAATLSALGLKISTGGRLVQIAKESAFPMTEVPAGTAPTMRISEFWNSEIMAVIVGGEVFLFENEMGKDPYVFRPGYTTGLYDPSLEGLSAIYPVLTLQPWIDTFFGVMAGWAMLSAIWPTYIESTAGATGNPTTEGPTLREVAFGKVVELPPGKRPVPQSPPPVGADLRGMLEFLLGVTDRFAPPILGGISPGSRIAGTAAAALREAAMGRLSSVVDNTEQLLEEQDALTLYLVDKVIGATVYAEGWGFDDSFGRRERGDRVGLSPRDIRGRYTTLRQLDTQSLQELITKGTHAVFMKQGTLWSGERASKFSGVDDVTAERMQMLREFLFDQLAPAYATQEAGKQEPTLVELLNQFLGRGEGEPPAQGPGEGEGGVGNVPGPAPRRGGRPTGSPKQPGGMRSVRGGRGRMTPTGP